MSKVVLSIVSKENTKSVEVAKVNLFTAKVFLNFDLLNFSTCSIVFNSPKILYHFVKVSEFVYSRSLIPKKSSKLRKLSKEDKFYNHAQSKLRICIEHTFLKRFRLFSERYRARRKTFAKSFNLFHFQFKFLSFRICLIFKNSNAPENFNAESSDHRYSFHIFTQ